MPNASKQIGEFFGRAWVQDHGFSMGPEAMGIFYGERRAASSLRLQSNEPVPAGRVRL